MPSVTYIAPDGKETTLDAHDGHSVMETAVKHGVRGIVAECGGACSCATCHVYVDEGFAALVGPPNAVEDDMLEGTASERRDSSRLSCQIRMRAELEGLRVLLPEEQV
ncbi:MAG TPA: 2Fe-2S iron-sulfur cluster-binding protein [Microbacterium sp.]|nr:2Fe-2S iron-sulfur cluster-binding protein [Microbacterium sp.]